MRWVLCLSLGCSPAFADEFRVSTEQAAVYAEPSAASAKLGVLPRDKHVHTREESGDFVRIRSRTDKTLWIHRSQLSPVLDSEPYDLVTDVQSERPSGQPIFKRIRLDFGASGGRANNESVIEIAVGAEYFMMERLSWRNAIFYRFAPIQPDVFGWDTSIRGNGNLPLGPLHLRGIIGAGYRFATQNQAAPFLEIGGFAELKGFDIGLTVKYLNHSAFASNREDVLLYSVVFSGNTQFF